MIVSIFKIRNLQLYFCSNFSSVSLDNTLIIKVPTIIGSKKYELSKHVKSNVTNYFINLNLYLKSTRMNHVTKPNMTASRYGDRSQSSHRIDTANVSNNGGA